MQVCIYNIDVCDYICIVSTTIIIHIYLFVKTDRCCFFLLYGIHDYYVIYYCVHASMFMVNL